jgi:hypothetical protein
MNMKTTEQLKAVPRANQSLVRVCIASCRKLIAQVQKAKRAILDEFRETGKAHEQLLQLALNEAEAVAWQTGFPHLVFPLLALEKAQAVAAWQTRQESIRRTSSTPALAA